MCSNMLAFTKDNLAPDQLTLQTQHLFLDKVRPSLQTSFLTLEQTCCALMLASSVGLGGDMHYLNIWGYECVKCFLES